MYLCFIYNLRTQPGAVLYGSVNNFAQEAKLYGAEVSNYAMFAVENGLCLGAFWTSELGAGAAQSVLAELPLRGGDLVGCVSSDLYPPSVSH